MESLIQDITTLICGYRKKVDSKEWKPDKIKEEQDCRDQLVAELTRIRSELEELL